MSFGFEQPIQRRQLLQSASLGLGGIALGSLLAQDLPAGPAGESNSAAPSGHFPATARSVIFLHMVGAPSQLDLFDNKPTLTKHHGELLPSDLWEGLRLAFIRKRPKLFGSPFKFRQHGQSGMELSELVPNLSSCADDITLVRSMHTEQINHAPAQLFMQTGFARFGRPCIGSWVSYGLGTENDNLPSFVVMNTGLVAGAGNSLWGSGFLPTMHQGVEFRSKGDPVLFLSNPKGIDEQRRRRIVDKVNQLNEIQLADVGDPEIATRIKQYEMAFKMQTSVPDLMDLSSESKSVHAMYGTKPGKSSFANNCLLARRLVERGVRFVQLYDQGWDAHGNLVNGLKKQVSPNRPAHRRSVEGSQTTRTARPNVGCLCQRIWSDSDVTRQRWPRRWSRSSSSRIQHLDGGWWRRLRANGRSHRRVGFQHRRRCHPCE